VGNDEYNQTQSLDIPGHNLPISIAQVEQMLRLDLLYGRASMSLDVQVIAFHDLGIYTPFYARSPRIGTYLCGSDIQESL
jgi:hypothetical protein